MLKATTAAAFLLSLSFIALSREAGADGLEGAVRLGLDATAVQYTSLSLKSSANSAAPEVDSTQSTFGLLGSGFGIGLGAAVHEQVVLGMRFGIAETNTEVMSSQSSVSSVTIMPSFEYLFGTNLVGPRPFLALTGGYETTTTSPGGGTDRTVSTFLGGGGFGLHGFLTPSFSIDPALNVFYVSGSQESGALKFDTTGFTVWVNIGISGWIRRSQQAALPETPAPPPPEVAPQPAYSPPPPAPPAQLPPPRAPDPPKETPRDQANDASK